MAPPRAPRRGGNGVALGVLGAALLAFFSIVFMLGRHHYSFSETYEAVLHDPRNHRPNLHLPLVPATTAGKSAAERCLLSKLICVRAAGTFSDQK